MNNNGFIFNPFQEYMDIRNNQLNLEKLFNKIDRLEKNIRILENRINILEKKEPQLLVNDDPIDKYMI